MAITGLYGIVRHPMQASMLILLIFSSNIYTVDRIVFLSANFFGILVGINMEEKRLQQRFPKYIEYKKKVTSRLIPLIY